MQGGHRPLVGCKAPGQTLGQGLEQAPRQKKTLPFCKGQPRTSGSVRKGCRGFAVSCRRAPGRSPKQLRVPSGQALGEQQRLRQALCCAWRGPGLSPGACGCCGREGVGSAAAVAALLPPQNWFLQPQPLGQVLLRLCPVAPPPRCPEAWGRRWGGWSFSASPACPRLEGRADSPPSASIRCL